MRSFFLNISKHMRYKYEEAGIILLNEYCVAFKNLLNILFLQLYNNRRGPQRNLCEPDIRK